MRNLLVSVSIALGLFLCCSAVPTASADGCLESHRTVKFPDGSARLKSYICTLGKAKKPQIRAEFYRLSVIAAGSLVHGTPYPDLERMFGTPQVLDNATGAEVKKLFDQFGSKTEGESCYTTNVASAAQAEPFGFSEGYASEGETEECRIRRTVWHLDFEGSVEMPLKAEAEFVLKEKGWPSGYNFFYVGDCSKDSPIDCTTLWRPATPTDVEDYDTKIQKYLDNLSKDPKPSNGRDDIDKRRPKLALIEYLMRDWWVDGFLFVIADLGSCGVGELAFEGSLGDRSLALDTAVITNISDKAIAVDSVLGNALTGGLRKDAPEGTTLKSETIAVGRTLKPGETLAIPLKLLFTTEKENFADKKAADRIFGWIKKARPGRVFSMTGEEDPTVLKLRESFKPPSVPLFHDYVYGPELDLKGIGVDGNTLAFAEASRNLVHISDEPEFGSCPYLYAWDYQDGVWVHMGKIIHTAQGRSNETTQRISFDGFKSKFRLAEEELELSYIDSAVLEVELVGGGGMTLRPTLKTLGERDGNYALIYAHENITFDFSLPTTVKSEDIQRSTLAVTGYYRRYSSLMMARQ